MSYSLIQDVSGGTASRSTATFGLHGCVIRHKNPWNVMRIQHEIERDCLPTLVGS